MSPQSGLFGGSKKEELKASSIRLKTKEVRLEMGLRRAFFRRAGINSPSSAPVLVRRLLREDLRK